MSIVRAAVLAAFAAVLATQAQARTISLTTADSVSLSADLLGSGDQGVVLVHGNSGDRSGWSVLAESLSQAGRQVVAVDLRGHGASKGESDPLKMAEDAKAAAAYLRKHGATRVTVVGAKLGGNIALSAAASDPEIDAVVMISPALNANGVKVTAALKSYGDRPLYLIAGSDDNLSRKAVDLIDNAVDNSTVQILESGGSGMALVHRASDLESLLLAWSSSDPKSSAADLNATIETSDTTNLQTTGTKLGEK